MDIDMMILSNIMNESNKQVSNLSQSKKTISNAKKDYYDEYLTGLTDEEREEIKKRAAAYIKDKNLDLNDKSALHELENFIAGLLKKFGYKGDIDEMSENMAFSAIFDNQNDTKVNSHITYDPYDTTEIRNAYYNMIQNPYSNKDNNIKEIFA